MLVVAALPWLHGTLAVRSLLAVVSDAGMKARMNRLKFRQWYRPVAPVISDEALQEVFGVQLSSPYMTMARYTSSHVRSNVNTAVRMVQ